MDFLRNSIASPSINSAGEILLGAGQFCPSTSHTIYSVYLTDLPAFSSISASITLIDECITPKSSLSRPATTLPTPPTWRDSKDVNSQKPITPQIVGSTSSSAVIQWSAPLLNCDDCEILNYNVTMSIDGGEQALVQQTQQKVALLTRLTTQRLYSFQISALTKYGWSMPTSSSEQFSVSAEAPDSPVVIIFEASQDDAQSSVAITIYEGKICKKSRYSLDSL